MKPALRAATPNARAAPERGLLLLVLWIVLMPRIKATDLSVGAIAASLAAWTSVRLLPHQVSHLRILALIGLVPHFLWPSTFAGVDMAGRALGPRMTLKPAFVHCPVRFSSGLACNHCVSITTQSPGSLPLDNTDASVVFYCAQLDALLTQRIAEEEKRLSGALLVGERHV